MRCILAFAVLSLLAGCSQQPVGPPPKIDPPAVCSTKAQCDAMWAEAMVQAQNLSGMRIQTATDSFLQTFNPTDFGRMGAMARKVPQPDGTTVIEASFTCGYCGNLAYDAVNLFTSSVKLAGSGFGPPRPTKSVSPADLPAGTAPNQPLSRKEYQDTQIEKLMQENVSYEEYQRRYKAIMAQ